MNKGIYLGYTPEKYKYFFKRTVNERKQTEAKTTTQIQDLFHWDFISLKKKAKATY